ncbi:hypothetical protein RHMOL_Rhmol10G0268200 [Rhododendron molle]|uniref:Uncharacterized protein n=1 Tax=Rhododendron molle TaxID=49168 RepID=A0ACC0M6B6_RHOML|nr:hypothetical protein RHMOL_Rhmol10G0268200 [Rhododendron molle]
MGICGNDTAAQPTAFQMAAQGLLKDLETATPRINGYFAAATRAVSGGGGTVYAVAQCAQRGGSSNKAAIIGGIIGGGGCLLLIVGLILWYHRSTKAKAASRGEILGASELQGPKTFSYKDLKSATNNFSNETKLGEGGFGDVFKGTLKNGSIVAVKKLVMETSRAKADFATEVKLISNVHHRNLLRLLGCSTKGPDLLLVYDYMENGSLDKFLYGEMRGTLNWNQRFDIIFGTARGLAYLHDEFHVTIIHRDIKCSNILLAWIMSSSPKSLISGWQGFYLRVRVISAPNLLEHCKGYTAPEYAIHGQLTEKVDNYSFGIVVLEIISGRKCSETKTVEDEPVAEYLLEQAWKLYENDLHSKLVDEILVVSDGYTEEAAKKIIELALMCTQTPASSRPSMSEVVMLLSDRSMDLTMRPGRHAFMDKDRKIRNDASTTPDSSTSDATASFTEFTGR